MAQDFYYRFRSDSLRFFVSFRVEFSVPVKSRFEIKVILMILLGHINLFVTKNAEVII